MSNLTDADRRANRILNIEEEYTKFVIYWDACRSLTYAAHLSGTAPGPSTRLSRYHDLHYGWNVGLRTGGSRDLRCRNWSSVAEFTWYSAENHDTTIAGPNPGIAPRLIPAIDPYNCMESIGIASLSLKLFLVYVL